MRSTLNRATLPLLQDGDHLHYNNRHIDTYADEDHERPHNHELWPGTCAKAPVRIRREPEAFTIWPEGRYPALCHCLGRGMHDTTQKNRQKRLKRTPY